MIDVATMSLRSIIKCAAAQEKVRLEREKRRKVRGFEPAPTPVDISALPRSKCEPLYSSGRTFLRRTNVMSCDRHNQLHHDRGLGQSLPDTCSRSNVL
jgi:hypothetical protein